MHSRVPIVGLLRMLAPYITSAAPACSLTPVRRSHCGKHAPAQAAARVREQTYSIRIVSVSRPIRIIKRSIRAILCTESASTADSGHALPKARETAIRRASKGATVVCAPRVILGFGPRSYPDSKNENSHYDHRFSHDCLLPATVNTEKLERRLCSRRLEASMPDQSLI